jgi:hypothetical protein
MSNFAELVTSVIVLIVSFSAMVALRPKKGVPIWWVRLPFVGPLVTILIVTGIAVGGVLLASYFTAIDDINLSGKKAASMPIRSLPTHISLT